VTKERDRIDRLRRRLCWLEMELRNFEPEAHGGRRMNFIAAEASALRWALTILSNLYPPPVPQDDVQEDRS
jgi:hypothetical protein